MENLCVVFNSKIIWFSIGAVFLILEFTAPAFVSIFFCLGAWVVMTVLFLTGISLNVQLSVFLVSSITFIVIFRKKLVVLFQGHKSDMNPKGDQCDDFIGFKALAETDIPPGKSGKISYRGASWSAETDIFVQKGATVEITGKKGLTLIVKNA